MTNCSIGSEPMKKNTFLAFLCITLLLCLAGPGIADEQKRPRLLMVTEATFPPYEFVEKGKIVGIDPHIVREIADRLGYDLKVENMKFDSLIAAVQTGKADIAAAGITVTEDRKKAIDFTVPYSTQAAQRIIVPKGSPIRTPADLKGKRIAVQHGTTGDTFVREHLHAPEAFENSALAMQALIGGKADAVVLDHEPASVYVARNPDCIMLEEPLTQEEYAFAIRKGRTELLNGFNRELEKMRAEGRLEEIFAIYQKKNQEVAAEQTVTPEMEGFFAGIKQSIYINFVKDDRYMYLVKGFAVTLIIALSAVMIGVLIGFLVAVIRSTSDQTGRFKILNGICKIYLTVIRGTPVVVQLLIIYFVIFGAVDVDKLLVAIIAFGLNSGAYVAEVIRSGIMSIDRGQLEAGRSLGLTYSQTMIHIILPQALKNVLPALGNEFIVLLKETSVAGYIALEDLTKGGDIIRSQTYDAFLPLLAVAAIYLSVVMLFTRLLGKLEGRLKKNE